jgi:predicted permease
MIRRMLRLRDVERDLDEELRFHFESVVEELMRGGRSRGEAEEEARRRFGDEDRYRRELTRIDHGASVRLRWSERWDAIRQTARFAARGLARSPGLSLGIVLAFALGIGANATVFGIVDRLLLSPPAHVAEPESVRRILIDRYISFLERRVQGSTIAYDDYAELTALPAFASVGAYSGRRSLTLGSGAEAVPVNAVMVTASFWETLGVRPAVGRLFEEEEDRAGAAGVAVLSWGLWQRMLGGETSALGRTIDFGQGPYTIVGVAPEGFAGVNLLNVDLWLPAHTAGAALQGADWLQGRGAYWLNAVARLAPGATVAVAEAQATAAHRAGRQANIERGFYDAEVRVLATPLIAARGPNPSAESRVARWLGGVSAIVLLIACVNIANLLLARGVRQRRETGIRLALGVSRARLLGQTVVEALLLALMGAGAALLAAQWGGQALRNVLLPDFAWTAGAVGSRIVVFCLLLALVAGVVAAIMPAVATARGDAARILRGTSGGITSSTMRTRALLTVAQAALSVVLLVGAGLFVRSLRNVQQLDLGFDPDGLLIVRPVEDSPELQPGERLALFTRVAERLGAVPGVTGATYTRGAPFYTSYAEELRAEGLDSIPSHTGGGPYVFAVGPDYLETMRMRIVRGRGFDEDRRGGGPPVTLINEAMARLLWPGQEVVGKCLYIGDDATACTTVIGVVADARRGSLIEPDAHPQYFVRLEQEAERTRLTADDSGDGTRIGVYSEKARPEMLLVRVRDDASGMLQRVRDAVLASEPRLRYVNVTTLSEELIQPQMRAWTLGATMFSVFGGLALLVAALGLYSVLAFDVAQRTREIGLRSALGADTGALLGMVVRRAVLMCAAGVTLGLAAAALLSPRVSDLLYETAPRDPATMAGVAVVLLAVAVLASGAPAWRAARVDPNIALRAE